MVPVLLHSNAPWVGTGYGGQAGLFGPLLDEHYRVAFSAFHGLRGSRIGWTNKPGRKPLTVYPGGYNAYGNDVLGAHAQHWFQGDKRGFILLLTDPWVISPEITKRIPTAAWTPVDHDPLMRPTRAWFEEGSAFPIAMSRFGQRVLAEANVRHAPCVPHAFDPDIFRPGDREAARSALKLPRDAFIVAMVAANQGTPGRKCFAEAIAGFARFQRSRSDAVLYLHTKLEHPEGEDIPEILKHYGVRAVTADQYGLALGTPPEVVALVHQAADVLLNPARGEGFGVPLIEAQACGTPCIVTGFSAMKEVAPPEVGNWNVGGQEFWTQFHSLQVIPSITEIAEALAEAYGEPDADRDERRSSVQAHAQQFRVDRVLVEHMLPALAEAERHFQLQGQRLVEQ